MRLFPFQRAFSIYKYADVKCLKLNSKRLCFAQLCSNNGDGNTNILNHADTVTTCFGSNANVAFFAPAGAPGVSDDPVFCTRGSIGTPSDHSNSMVYGLRASLGVKNTTLVVLEVGVLSLHTDGNNATRKSFLPCCVVPGSVFSSINLSHHISQDRIRSHCARALNTGVGIIRRRHHSLCVGVGVIDVGHKATTAAIVTSCRAVNKLLFRQVRKSTKLYLIETLQLSVGGESVACTAATLVLNGINSAECAPVNGSISSS